MSESSESTGALGTLFFYVLFVHPVCSWILAPKRFRKDRAIVYAILFLATIAFGKIVSEINFTRKPYFHVERGDVGYVGSGVEESDLWLTLCSVYGAHWPSPL